ncbi:MAG: MFS transporter [Anaerolineales bacterium]
MKPRYRWYVAAVMFAFLLLHQADKLLIGPLTTNIMDDFQINEAQMGAVSSLAIIVASVLYPLWGYLYDRFARSKLLALASLIWGGTTWLNALAPTYGAFMVTRSSTGIDDSSYPGLYSLLSDYFGPRLRGKVYGLMQMSGPLGFMLGTVLATALGGELGWRRVFYLTGGLGVVLSVVIFTTVREVPRGSAEPEFQGLEGLEQYRINWDTARGLLKNRTLLLLMAQGFFGVFPWNVLIFWFFRYLETERNYTSGQALSAMMVAIVTLSAGYFVGGYAGDRMFKRTPRGRPLVGAVGVILGAIFLYATINVPVENRLMFAVLLGLTGITMSVASPNVIATVHDTTVPEARSTARSFQKLVEDGGAATAPFLAGLIAVRYSLEMAILVVCISTWIVCAVLFLVTAAIVPKDIERFHETMNQRLKEIRDHA